VPLVALEGGQGASWRAGDLVLKPVDMDPAELAWHTEVYSRIQCDGFRIARIRPAANGAMCVDGWCATEYVAGEHRERQWAEVIEIGERFHAALREVPRPAFLDRRTNPWSIGDRVAWGELPAADFAHAAHVSRLAEVRRPIAAPSQLIHGDLCGNVLFHDELPPAVIDFSPYWRPVHFASAVVVGDALIWEGADARLLDAVSHIADFGQYLVRALIFRAVTEALFAAGRPADGLDDRWESTVNLACELAR
jgi:uncharacterized protein (TIGR02569 family)